MTKQIEKHPFQAEVRQVLSLVVNSLYTHKEVFLRELISNASDALDQLSFRALTDPQAMGDDAELAIDIVADEEAGTLTLSDNGVGMTHDELVTNLGTIAHSGTRKLIESLSGDQRKDVSLIGQFGVGFYSAFLVADRVEVVSRAAGSDQAWRWESDAEGEFTVEEAERAGRGTDVVLHLREAEKDFLREWTVREQVRKWSDYVRHPIRLMVERAESTQDEDEDAPAKTERKFERINQASALWTRPRGEITDEQAAEFYRHLTHDWNAPLAWSHFQVEGMTALKGLVFLPERPMPDFMAQKQAGLRLFVKRVFIMEDAEELLPQWLRFVRGVVDSEDLPLNVSREFLQRDRISTSIKKQVVKKVLSLLEELAGEGETEVPVPEGEEGEPAKRNRYEQFWREYGRILKEGIHFDPEYRERIAKLLRFESSHGEGLTSFEEYVGRMAEGQEAIYFIAAETRGAAQGSPHLEALRRHGFEVLYMLDAVDEWVVEALKEFDGKRLVSAAKGGLDLGEEKDEEERKERQSTFEGLLSRMKEFLDERVKDVRLSDRLVDSPACLVADEHGMSPHVERLLKANKQAVPEQKRILELNAAHAVVKKLNDMAGDEARSEQVRDWTALLYDQALVAEGSPPSDPAGFARRVAKLMETA